VEFDEILAERCQSGDAEAFGQLVERYKKRVFNLALRMLRNHDDAEDIAQETFLHVFRAIRSFRIDQRFSTWIYKVASNLCIDLLRRRRHPTVSLDAPLRDSEDLHREIPDWSSAPSEVYDHVELHTDLQRVIDRLPPRYRLVIVLRHTQDLSYEEIAAITEMPLGTVKTRLFRAREIMRRDLERAAEGGESR
jgi:RNA polymerase sigma-70 factor (ECF subfamily)